MAALTTAAAVARASAPTALRREIDRIALRPPLAHAWWGIEVRSLRSGRVLYARDAEKNFKPASTLKLVTAAAALDALGPDARLRTTVETAGRLDAYGRILGDVYLVGGGDPNLSGRFHDGRTTATLEELAGALHASGVRRIEGRLIGHEALFGGDRRGEDWAWNDLVWSYGAEVSALSFNDNAAQLRAIPGERVGDPLVVERDPVSAHYGVVSTAVTSAAGGKPELVLRSDPGSNLIRLSGSLPHGGEPWAAGVAIADPARYAAVVFSEVLAARGISLTGTVATSSDPLPAGRRVLAARESEPLAEILRVVNKKSQNLHSEMLLRLLGARVKGEGTVEAGHEAVEDFLRRLGVPAESWDLRDASGLSRSDIVTPRGLAALLVAMDKHPHAAAFRDSLPVAGVDGTLEGRMRGTAAQGRVRAKTGSLRHVNALAGYATHRGGERLVFAIVLNHHTAGGTVGVGAIDDIVNALVTR
ncbi:MAG TPA: D-alanyl-D-alanine carboxypeptidase/D-alanyl-D-alanine-endopeptidase [Vicinamibacteria bacterium]|nr:D-alanyl-D-alanine carboxypeptidase/D-alanyl-D-alanine-endopeptidase [Vicinamibacteria bacterium]